MKAISLSKPLKDFDFNLNWDLLFYAGVISMAFFALMYIVQVTKLTKGYYLVNTYEQQISQLQKENKDLEISLANDSVLDKISEKIQESDFAQTSSVKYLYISDDSLALSK